MLRLFDRRAGHYVLIVIVWAMVCLPNLGGPVLWDIDEGLNAEASREMLASGNYVVPTFNYQLRTAKPALLYWLQTGCYHLLGVHETSARLPSALAALLAVLGVYELGRFAFGKGSAFLGAIIFLTSVGVLGAAHFANPDGLLLAFTTWTLALYFRYWQCQRPLCLYAAAVAAGLAVLAKGPVGLVLPGAVVVGFLLWQRQLRRLVDRHLLDAFLIFFLVAAPWYVWVGVETKGQYLREFFEKEHYKRSFTAMENHTGSYLYYLGALLIGFLPWSIFIGTAVWDTTRQVRTVEEEERPALRFLILWLAIWILFFSLVKTKLPNYILPLYPAAALLTARMLERWRTGQLVVSPWLMQVSLTGFALVGLLSGVFLLVASGTIETQLPTNWRYPGLAAWAWLGLVPILGAVIGSWMLMRDRRSAMIGAIFIAGLVFVGGLAGGALQALNLRKATALLAQALPTDHEYHEVRLACYGWDRPTLVFYCRREVRKLDKATSAIHFFHEPLPVYLFIPEARWRELESQMPVGVRVLARQPDLYARGEPVLLVTNGRGLP
jgi:4-amino-4-deoxy-L-arabinose transferase-like glycosyltransferase